MTKIVETRVKGFPLVEGMPFTNYNADEEFIYQINRFFPGILSFEVVSRKGESTRTDVLLKGKFSHPLGFSENCFYVYVFILYEGGKGRAHDDELRTQLNAYTAWKPLINTLKVATEFRDASSSDLQNKECYCIGIYKRDKDDHNVAFVGMPAEVLCKSETEKINPTSTFQTYGELVREMYFKDIIVHEKKFTASSTFNLTLFKPKYFLWYMKHRDELHINDIDKANEVIKEIQKERISYLTKNNACQSTEITQLLVALRTKPFVLLAGISGTGKSRIVRELAFKSCPKVLQEDKTTPGNYCMIEVKPNWHDSTELLGYWSNINKKYMFTKFVKFLVKAKMYPNVPFFVCLDEMNLAPVEQYFAEFLSVLETRQLQDDGTVKSGALIDKEYFEDFAKSKTIKDQAGIPQMLLETDRGIYFKLFDINDKGAMDKVTVNTCDLLRDGLTLPDNVFIIGTVNMDDTTHQFSRKVIDRAMTIEMNGGKLSGIFSGKKDLAYCENDDALEINFERDLKAHYVNAVEVIEQCQTVQLNSDIMKFVVGKSEKDSLPTRLEKINTVLAGTPFTVSYRVMNELTILLAVLLDEESKNKEVDYEKFEEIVATAIDRMLLMKILPRVEGDDEMFRISGDEKLRFNLADRSPNNNDYDYTKLDWLRAESPQRNTDNTDVTSDNEQEGQTAERTYMAIDKLDEMITRLHRQNFTRYWP